MSFDRDAIERAIRAHGPVVRVVVASVGGSAPREVGASMLVWENGQSGTIGGGALEFQAADWARAQGGYFRRVPLGPAMGQCCGGAVTLLAERFEAADLQAIDTAYLRRVEGTSDAPLALHKALADQRNSGSHANPQLVGGWFIEPVTRASRPLWIYGAGHVGRAIVAALVPLPDFAITWVDTGPDRYPDSIPDGVTQLVAADPADCVRYAPTDGEHLILTYSHALDLELCHRLLGHGFSFAGLIGSDSKWARFRSRLRKLGHTDAQISRITCPIGQKELGKHPQAIAIGVAMRLISPPGVQATGRIGETG